MKSFSQINVRYLLLIVMVFCVGVHIFSQTNNKRYVAVQTAALKSSTGFFAGTIGKLSLGDEVTVIRQSGKWTQVSSENSAGNLSGWVASSSLSVRPIISSGRGVAASEVALAGKGFSKDMETEYRKDGLNYSMVDFMEQLTITQNELESFITEGRLARGE